MEKKIQDYLHLYLGCNCKVVKTDEDGNGYTIPLTAYSYNYYKGWLEDLKPILRPLSDMTVQERIEWDDIELNAIVKAEFLRMEFTAEQTRYLLSKRFDIFGLIEAGLAVDKTKMNIESK